MKIKYLLLLIFNLIYTAEGMSQMYISELSNNEIIFGPNSIPENKILVAPFYISKLNDIKYDLVNSIEYEINLIKELKDKENSKRREKRELRKAFEAKQLIDSEINRIDSIENLWNDLLIFQESLIEASELIKAGKCIEFTTESGKFYSDELNIEVKEYSERVEIKESIPIEYESARTQWVKKKTDRNCLSPNPEDCLVWCLIEITEGFKFKDMTGKEYKYEYCPNGFEYNDEDSECLREIVYNEEYEFLEMVSLVRNRSKEIVNAINWKIIECD